MKIKINYDVYNISNRLRIIDRGYFIVYDTSKMKFEVHHKNQVGGSYCLTLPFPCLDARTIDYVKKTRTENLASILKEIEKDNFEAERNEQSRARDLFNEKLENLLAK